MGVFDFVKNAGAKVGIGTSTDEDAAAEAAATAAKAAADAKVVAARRAAIAEGAERRANAKKAAAAALEERRDKAKQAKMKADAKARMAEYSKSSELEKYVSDLGIEMGDIEIRFRGDTAYISGETADEATRERIILAVGNAQGVAKVDEEIVVSEPAPSAHFHTVASGDTLWALAEKVYGDGSRYTEIFEANKPMLKNADMIYPGQVLRCPLGENDS